jgi:glycerol-3-phosphate dehydrogenase
LVKGSHIVVPRLYPGEHAYLLQNVDRRVVLAIPFEGFTLVGTTDVDWNGAPAQPTISGDEIDYLLATVSRNFTATVTNDDIVWSYSGLRALWDDGASDPSKLTRDYRLRLDVSGAPLLNVFGGKITTYRLLAEQAVDRLASHFPAAHAWTETAVLPGGEIADLDIPAFVRELVAAHPELPEPLLSRLARTYGTRVERLLDGVASTTDLGRHLGADLYAREVDYLMAHEWAQSADDILWRRTKLGLHVTKNDAQRLADYIAALD